MVSSVLGVMLAQGAMNLEPITSEVTSVQDLTESSDDFERDPDVRDKLDFRV